MAAKPKRKGIGGRLTAKVGPFPVWAWVLAALAGYLAYRRFAGGGSSTATLSPTATSADSNATPVGLDSGSPPASGAGGPAGNVSDDLLSQLSGFQTSIDTLTAAVQSSDAYATLGGGDSGYGAFATGSATIPTTAAQTVARAKPAALTPAALNAALASPTRVAKPAAKAPAKPVVTKKRKPVSGYAQTSKANLH